MSVHGSLIGSRLGEFDVEALIGRGAMGAVYLARDVNLGRHVALKVLLGSLARSPDIVRQFHQEAQAAAPLKHPGIVRMYTAGVEHGTPYIAMEYVDGEPLDRFLRRKRKISWNIALHIGSQIAEALDCAHAHGIVHRDIKPANVMLDRKGRVRLTDFGIARVHSEDSGSPGEVLGTPQYMSPEQVSGGAVGPASDLFSLGVLLYQMISGELPFRGESSIALVKSICEDSPPRLNRLEAAVPDDVARMVAYLMEKDPSQRPASARVASGLMRRLQKQRGTNTAIADSLTQFLKEEMEPQAFSGAAGTVRKSADSKVGKKAKRVRPSWMTVRNAAHLTAAGLLIVGAFLAGPWTAARARVQAPPPAPRLDLATFQSGNNGSQRVLFFLDGYELTRISWTGTGAGLLVHVEGERGALTDGSEGLLGVDPGRGEIHSLIPPRVDGGDESEAVSRAGFTTHAIRTPGDLADTILLSAYLPGGERAIFAQHWKAGAPSPRVLYRSEAAPSAASAMSPVAASPSGDAIVVWRAGHDQDGDTLRVRRIDTLPYDALGPNRLSPGVRIRPGSVQYTPAGSRIAYLRAGDGGLSSLWMLDADGTESDGHRIALGVVGNTFSISPDGERIALVRQVGRRTPRVEIIDSRAGTTVTRFGPGTVSREAWLPDGREVVFTGSQGPGESVRQLWIAANAVDAQPRPVTQFRSGVGKVYAVSPDGSQVALLGGEARIPTIHVIPLTDATAGG